MVAQRATIDYALTLMFKVRWNLRVYYVESLCSINREPMSLSVIKEAMSVLDTISRLPTGAITFTNAVMSIFHVLSVILETNGAEGWHKKVNEAMGEETLNPDDERNLQPIAHLLLKLRDSKATEPLESLFKQQGGSAIDAAYMKGVDAIKNINTKVRQMAADSGSGITQYQNEMDLKPDPRPFESIRTAGAVGLILAQIPIPVRLMIFLVYSALDVVRLMTAGSPIMRQLLSACLALIELLKGDWKKSLLSFSGIFSQSMVWTGFVGKIFLELFSLISPQLQDSIAFGALRVTKSIVLGFLIQIFKITAPEKTRIKVVGLFQKLAQKKGCLDEALVAAGMSERPEGLASAKGIIEDDVRNCSTEFFEDAIQAAQESKIMNLVLQLANIPTNAADVKTQCKRFLAYADKNGYVSWKDLLVAEGLMRLAEKEDKEAAPTGNAALDALLVELQNLEEEVKKVTRERKAAEKTMLELINGPSTASVLSSALSSDASAAKNRIKDKMSAETVYKADININLPLSVPNLSIGPTGTASPAVTAGPTGSTGPTSSTGPTGSTGSTSNSSSPSGPSPPLSPSPPTGEQTPDIPSETPKSTTPPSDLKGGSADYSYSEND